MVSRAVGVLALTSMILIGVSASASAQQSAATQPKPATDATKAANRDLEHYSTSTTSRISRTPQRGLIDSPDTLTIKDAKGNVVWDLETYKTVHRRRQAGARHGQPEPVAQRAAQHAVRPVQGAPTASTRCAATTSPTSPSSRATPAGSWSTR